MATYTQQLQILALQELFAKHGISEEIVNQGLATYLTNPKTGLGDPEAIKEFATPQGTIDVFVTILKDKGVTEEEMRASYQEAVTKYANVPTVPEGWLSKTAEAHGGAAAGAVEGAATEIAEKTGQSPDTVRESLRVGSRLGAINPNRRVMESVLDPNRDADLIEKATQARTWDKQQKAYDTLWKLGRFTQNVAGAEPSPYGFQPAIARPAMSAEDAEKELAKIEQYILEWEKIEAESALGEQDTEAQREITKRKVYEAAAKQYNEERSTLTGANLKRVEALESKKKGLEKSYDPIRAKVYLTRHPKRAAIETARSNVGSTYDPVARGAELNDKINSLAGDPEAQFHLIYELVSKKDQLPGIKGITVEPNWQGTKESFIKHATKLSADLDENSKQALRAAYEAYAISSAEAKRLRKEIDDVQTEIDQLVVPGQSPMFYETVRTANKWARGIFEGEDGEEEAGPRVSAPLSPDDATASSYVSGVMPGAAVVGTDVRLPSGDVVPYSDFVSEYPSAAVDSSGQIRSVIDPGTVRSRAISRLEKRADDIREAQDPLSEMDRLKEDIIEDSRFRQWMQAGGYTNTENAFEFFKKEIGARTRSEFVASTDRQIRDLNILTGQEDAGLGERVAAFARTAKGPLGKQRRQRRRQAVLGALTPGAKKSRITEGDAVEATPEAPAAETVAPAADTGRPENAITKWKDDTYEYSIEENGNITYVKPDGKTVTVEPGSDAYNAIMTYRTVQNALEYDPDSEYVKAISEARAKEELEGRDVETALPEQVPFTKEQLVEELAGVPDAPALPGEMPTLRERIAFGKEEREMKPLKEGSKAEAEKAAILKKAEDAIAEARAKGEEAPEWAILTRDAALDRTIKPQGRGEVITEGTGLPSDEAVLSLPDGAAPEKPALPTTWTDGWAEYTLQPDGKITYKSPSSGKTITVDPEKDKKNYATIMGARKADTTETVAEENTLPEVAPGDYISTQMEEEGRLPLPAGQSKLPRKKAGLAYGMEEDIRLGGEEDSPPVEGEVEISPDTEENKKKKKRRWLQRILSEGTGSGDFPL